MKDGRLVFSMTGFLSYYKGVDILLDAWTGCAELAGNDSIRLIIAGEGKISFDTPSSCPNIQIINRFISDNEYKEIMDITDVGVLPYRDISQSGVLLTLLSYRKPVLVSSRGGLVQPFCVGNIGWILNELTPQSLAEQIAAIANNRKAVFEIQNNAGLWRDIEEFYSWKRIGTLTTDFYRKLLNES